MTKVRARALSVVKVLRAEAAKLIQPNNGGNMATNDDNCDCASQ